MAGVMPIFRDRVSLPVRGSPFVPSEIMVRACQKVFPFPLRGPIKSESQSPPHPKILPPSFSCAWPWTWSFSIEPTCLLVPLTARMNTPRPSSSKRFGRVMLLPETAIFHRVLNAAEKPASTCPCGDASATTPPSQTYHPVLSSSGLCDLKTDVSHLDS